MIEYKLIDFRNIDFQLVIDKSMHTEDFPMHTHDFTELIIITDGSALHSAESVTHPIKKGSVISMAPSFSHAIENIQNLKYYNFMFDIKKFSLLEQELKTLAGFQSFFLVKPNDKYDKRFISKLELDDEQFLFVTTLCRMIHDEYVMGECGSKAAIKSYFLSLIAYLSKAYMPDERDRLDKFYKIAETASYMEENFDKKIYVSQLAKMTYLSERQYCRVFKSVYNKSPIEYAIECRLNAACQMIKNSSKTLTEIADMCGFSDKAAFSRCFKQRFGIPPGKYR